MNIPTQKYTIGDQVQVMDGPEEYWYEGWITEARLYDGEIIYTVTCEDRTSVDGYIDMYLTLIKKGDADE